MHVAHKLDGKAHTAYSGAISAAFAATFAASCFCFFPFLFRCLPFSPVALYHPSISFEMLSFCEWNSCRACSKKRCLVKPALMHLSTYAFLSLSECGLRASSDIDCGASDMSIERCTVETARLSINDWKRSRLSDPCGDAMGLLPAP